MGSVETGTVGKALGVLELVSQQEGPVRFAELQSLSPLPKATLYRMVQTLVSEGMLAHDPETGAYSLGLRLVRLAHGAWRQTSLAPIARPHLEALSLRTGLTAHLTQLDYGHVLVLDRRGPDTSEAAFTDAGKVAPAYCTAAGKAMLAWLDPGQLDAVLALQSFQRFTPATLASETVLREALARVRERGFAVDREEHVSGEISTAIAVLADDNRVLGAISLSAMTQDISLADLEAWLPDLRDCADRIATETTQWAYPTG